MTGEDGSDARVPAVPPRPVTGHDRLLLCLVCADAPGEVVPGSTAAAPVRQRRTSPAS